MFIYREAGYSLGRGDANNPEIRWFLEMGKKMTDIALDGEDGVSAHRPSGCTVQIKKMRMVIDLGCGGLKT
jgi:hypothetical protein